MEHRLNQVKLKSDFQFFTKVDFKFPLFSNGWWGREGGGGGAESYSVVKKGWKVQMRPKCSTQKEREV